MELSYQLHNMTTQLYLCIKYNKCTCTPHYLAQAGIGNIGEIASLPEDEQRPIEKEGKSTLLYMYIML